MHLRSLCKILDKNCYARILHYCVFLYFSCPGEIHLDGSPLERGIINVIVFMGIISQRTFLLVPQFYNSGLNIFVDLFRLIWAILIYYFDYIEYVTFLWSNKRQAYRAGMSNTNHWAGRTLSFKARKAYSGPQFGKTCYSMSILDIFKPILS